MSDDNRGPSVAAQIRRAPAWVRSQFTWKRALLIALWFAMLGVLVWVVCYGIAGRLAWGGVAFAVAVFVAYSLFLLITYVLPYLPRAGEWFVDHGVTYLTVIMMIILVVTLLTWWWVNFQWAAEDELTSEDHTALTIGGLVASGAYPAVALIAPDSADSDVLTLAVSSPPTTTLTTTLALTAVITPGMGLTFDRTPGVFSQEIDIEVKPGQTARDRAVIVNAETFAGLRTAGAINVSLRDAAGAELGALHLPVTVEGQRGFAVRSFVTSAVDEASPLIFLLLLVVPGLATLVQKAIDERTRQLKESRQHEFDALINELRDHLRLEDLRSAVPALKRLEDKKFRPTDTDEQRRLAKDLLLLAGWDGKSSQGAVTEKLPDKEPEGRILEMASRWPQEFAMAAVMGYRQYLTFARKPEMNRNEPGFRYWNRLLGGAKDRVLQLDLASNRRIRALTAELTQDELLVSARLPRRVLGRFPDPDYRLEIDPRKLSAPFSLDDARHPLEARFLFAGDGFWGSHPLLKDDLRVFHQSHVIFGERGTGRRALADVLPHYSLSSRNDLFVRLTGKPEIEDVIAAIGRQLLAYLLQQPTDWASFDEGLKELIVELLEASHDRRALLMQIRLAQKQTDQRYGPPVDAAIRQHDASADTRERARLREEFLQNARLQLAYLELAIQDYHVQPARGRPKPIQRLRNCLEITRALDFDHVVLIHEPTQEQLTWFALRSLEQWHAEGLRLCLFPEDDVRHDALSSSPILDVHHLKWDRRQLEEMAKWRFERYLLTGGLATLPPRDRNAIVSCFGYDIEAWELLLKNCKLKAEDKSSYNPRRFMELWRLAAGDKRYRDTINKANVEAAVAAKAGGSS